MAFSFGTQDLLKYLPVAAAKQAPLSFAPSSPLDREEEYPNYAALPEGPTRQPIFEKFARGMPSFGIDANDEEKQQALKAALIQAGARRSSRTRARSQCSSARIASSARFSFW